MNQIADKIAHDPPKVFMPGIGQKAAAVGYHADKPAQHSQICQIGQVAGYSVNMVVHPPGGSKLHPAPLSAGLEVARHGRDSIVVLRVQDI